MATVPFATADVADPQLYPQDFHPISRKTFVTEKAGKDGFDQAVYLANRAANAQNLVQSKARNHSSAGGTPYSLHDVGSGAVYGGKEFHPQHLHKELPDKIGTSATFDADAYRQSLAANQALHHELQQKKHGSAAIEGGGGGNSGSTCPFATCGGDESREHWKRNNYQAKGRSREMADKVGADKRFDPSIYSHNILLNRQQQADSLQRSYVGGGDILAFTPAGAAGGLPPAHAAK